MKILGIESTAHTLGFGLIGVNGKLKAVADRRDKYKPKREGIHPRKAAEHHAEVFAQLLGGIKDFDLIAVSVGPGLGPCLRIGCLGARYLALKTKKPLVGVNHAIAHIEIAKYFTKAKDPLIVYVSGGNTQIIVEKNGYKVMGETLDIGLGNLLDSFARAAQLEEQHGAAIGALAKKGKNYIEMPYTVKGMDLIFGGLLTDAEKKLKSYALEDVAYSLQETAFAMLIEATERALALTNKKEVLLCGGVASSLRLQEMMKIMCKERGCRLLTGPDEYNGDNGVMIAYAGYLNYKKSGVIKINECKPKQKMRVDSIH